MKIPFEVLSAAPKKFTQGGLVTIGILVVLSINLISTLAC